MSTIDVTKSLEAAASQDPQKRGLSTMARALIGSEILKIAAEVRERTAAGAHLLNLTVGDFSSREFPIPEALARGLTAAVEEGHTNYPPATGMLACREAVREMFRDRLGLSYPVESVIIAGGARPMIAGTYLALIDPGDPVIYGLPSWNNNHYCTLVGAEGIEIGTGAAARFFPRVEDIEPHLERARLLCLNTPQNPTGTVMEAAPLERIARRVVEENERRLRAGRPLLYLMFDQIYWLLTFGDARHTTPVNLVPEVAPYTIFVDGISKGFSATGLRVGWALGPPDVMRKMSAALTHIGAWAPRPEQVATAALLRDAPVVDQHLATMREKILVRLRALDRAVTDLAKKGWDVEAIAPQGAIYLSLRIGIAGKKAPNGEPIETDEDIRRFLLAEAGVALVPFTCFGLRRSTGWFRASVGAVSLADCEGIGERLERALSKLS